MKIVLLGGTGLIGSRMLAPLTDEGHEVVAAALGTGVDTTTGVGLAGALSGADVVVDVINSRSFDGVVEFFEASTRTAVAAAREAGVGHYVVLSIVGTDHVPDAPYLVAKARQEEIVRESGLPFTIVRATQFFEFVTVLADAGAVDGTVYSSAALVQPIAAADVATLLGDVALAEPLNAVTEIAGPEQIPLDRLIRETLRDLADPRPVSTIEGYSYFGAPINRGTLIPASTARLATTSYEQWRA